MNYFKSVFTLLLLLVTACNSETTPEPPIPTSTVPVETVSTPLPIENEPVSEATADEPDLIAVKFMDTNRVIPAGLDPVSQPREAISQYLQTTNDGSNLWAGCSVRGSNFFTLEILPVSHDLPELISVTFPLYLNVTKTTDSLSNSNVISLMGGGGGGNTKFFPSFSLQAGEF